MAKCYNKIYLKKSQIWVNCGKCLNCIAEKNKEYSIRFMHEIQNKEKYNRTYLLTLTYDEIHCPINNGERTLNKKHLTEYIEKIQRNIRKMKKKYNKIDFKYFACGEYGSITKRPHYHIVVATNWYIERSLKATWKYGQVNMQKDISVKAIAYACGYSQKKIGFNDKIYENKEIAFRKFSRGVGKQRALELIAQGKINNEKYYIDTNFWGKCRLPQYYKNLLKEHIMGVKEKRKLIKTEEDRLQAKRLGYEKEAKSYVVNINEYEKNYWKWEKFIEPIKQREKDRLEYLYKDKDTYKRYANNNELLYNLMYNPDYKPEDFKEILFKELHRRINEKIKEEAKAKYYRKIENRIAV